MTITVSSTVKGGMASGAYSAIGASPTIDILSASGNVLAQFELESTWATLSGSGSINLSSTPLTTIATATGAATSFRLTSSGGATHVTGSVGLSADDGDIVIDRLQITATNEVKILSWRMYVA